MIDSKAATMEWPPEGLEPVPNCPICGSAQRSLLYDGLLDRVFFVAPGSWSLWLCEQCRTAWLDPRPTENTIELAYRSYYTHEEFQTAAPRTRFQRLRSALGNGYRNRRYGTRLEPSIAAGSFIARLLPPLKWPVDVAYRFLPQRRSGETMRVLDIGCANGAWLAMAREAGWQVAGVEPDPVSGSKARGRGIEVRGSLADWLDEPESFDYVTISHVIEHVHDPLAVLRDSFALLRPGGSLYVDTPNIDAWGHRVYARDWLALDPPRHLILFNRQSLISSTRNAGFRSVRVHLRTDPFRNTSVQSRQIRAGLDPFSNQRSSDMDPPPGILMRLRAALARRRAEFLTLTAVKRR